MFNMHVSDERLCMFNMWFQTSDSVSLDLLTYADLESLRNRKSGISTKSVQQPRSNHLNSKRYLILTYTVEFDRYDNVHRSL